MTLPSDLANLPTPTIIQEISASEILDRKIATLQQLYTANGLPYNVSRTAYDPAIIQLEVSALDETLVRQRINEAARARLLAYATGSDLDHLALFYDVTRMTGEADARLVKRVRLAIQGRSTGGTEPRYRLAAMSADIRVADVIVYTVRRSPVIHVAIFSTDVSGVADADLISAVDAVLQTPEVRMVNDIIVVRTAIRTVVNISASVWLLPDASMSVLSAMQASLRDAWDQAQALGRNFAVSWWTSKLMLDGVHRIVPLSPIGNIIVPPDEAVALGDISLTFMGRDY
jgi:phage-related baseplate assembly protein